jgi:hypothetical protein
MKNFGKEWWLNPAKDNIEITIIDPLLFFKKIVRYYLTFQRMSAYCGTSCWE